MAIGTGASSEADKPGTGTIPAGDTGDIYAYKKGSKSNPIPSVILQNKEKPLCILDEKKMEKDFDLNSINPEEIASSYKLEDGVPTIYVGQKKDGGVIVTSSPVK